MDPALRPLWPGMRVVGRAMTVQVEESAEIPPEPYDGEMSALDALRPGDVAVYAIPPGSRAAAWGELFTCGAQGLGAIGAVIDGAIRDATQIGELGFPVFCRSRSPLDTLGRAVAVGHGMPVVCGGVEVHLDDVVVADEDGVVVIPRDLATAVATAVGEKRALEDAARADLLSGMGVRAVWAKYGVF